MTRLNDWLERRFWWWLIPLAVAGVVMGALAK